MDPTNDVAPTDGHVTLAWGRDYGDVSPLRGLILGGGGHTLKVEVDMEPVAESSFDAASLSIPVIASVSEARVPEALE